MSEMAEEEKSNAVTTIRENVKENIRIARLRHRQDELDSLRITHGDFEEHSINLQTFTTNDVLEIANKIKKQRHASAVELSKLCHAFLQSTDNINCFVNSTGAVPVIIKEMTGSKTETQILAIECLCNLCLGSENTSEKIAQKAGTYLHTFLQSSNESVVRTSLWCLTNLIVAGKKPLNILISQELIRALINVTTSIHNQTLTEESYTAIELILDYGGVPRSSDIETLSEWILNQATPIDLGMTKIVYKLLNLLEFKSNDAIGMQKLGHIAFETLIYLHNITSTSTSPQESVESLHQVVLLMRICSNLVAVEPSYADYIIENWFRTKSRSLAAFFNHFIEQIAAVNLSMEEIYWFIGNLMKCKLSGSTLEYLESDAFFATIKMEA